MAHRSETIARTAAEKAFGENGGMETLAALEAADRVYFAAISAEKAKIAALNATPAEMYDAEVNANDTESTEEDELYRLQIIAATIELSR